jgi:hypothetical protein
MKIAEPIKLLRKLGGVGHPSVVVRTDFVRTEFVRTEFVRTGFVRTGFVSTGFVSTGFEGCTVSL